MLLRRVSLAFAITLIASLAAQAADSDWPMQRCNAGRTAVSRSELPAKLSLSWTRQELPLTPAWPDEARLQFDAAYEPVVVGKTLFYGSPRTDCLMAVSTETGEEQWRYYADGPIRFAPVAAAGKVYFGSDDGCLYCLNAADGTLRWRVRGAPVERNILGNQRLISSWPVRGAPVLFDGTVYFAAGIWPFMGVFIHAVDAETGKTIWTNDGSGSVWMHQPHNSPAFAAVAPQGYLAACESTLILPNGRSQPAGLDRKSGAMQYLNLISKLAGSYQIVVAGDSYFAPKERSDLRNGVGRVSMRGLPVVDGETVYTCDGRKLWAESMATKKVEGKDSKGKKIIVEKPAESFNVELPEGQWQLHLKAGSRLYLAGKDSILAVDAKRAAAMKVVDQYKVAGEPATMIAAADRLFFATRDGQIQCLAGVAKPPTLVSVRSTRGSTLPADTTTGPTATIAKRLLEASKATGGYCVVLGLNDGQLVEQLVRQSKLHVIAIDADAGKVTRLRRYFDDLGLYGERVALHAADPLRHSLPPYLAELITSEQSAGVRFVMANDDAARLGGQVFSALRPYGGTACLPLAAEHQAALQAAMQGERSAGAVLKTTGAAVWITRPGPLPGAGTWTHQYGDVANTVVSADTLVRAPLGLLWFGGPSHRDVLPRHGHGPAPQVIGGRLFIEGPDSLRATDVYTGRVLWTARLTGLGKVYDNTAHQPGANALGSNYASATDGVYVAHGERCVRLDVATGEVLREFTLPGGAGGKPARWGYVGLFEDLLIAGATPLVPEGKPLGTATIDGTASQRIVVMDRHNGRILWQRDAALGFRHNAIVAGAGKLFCIDMLPDAAMKQLRRRGQTLEGQPAVLALDIRSGTVAWRRDKDVFGTWLGYSTEHDILVQAGRPSRDMLETEPDNRMAAYRGASGDVVWDAPHKYGGPVMLHGKRIIAQGAAFDLRTGAPLERANPLTGENQPWRFTRNYGCNTAIASQCLLTFRSAAAGYFDLTNDGGTGNLGGFKSGCTSNLIVADGVLNAPDYTRTCTCDYQNQTSLAMVPMPEAETWTFNEIKLGDAPVLRVGINFGAPGDRRAADGTLWLDYPSVGGPSPDLKIRVEPEKVRWFRHHALNFAGEGFNWVAASGVEGVEKVVIPLAKGAKADRLYTVRLTFAEPNEAPGRVPFSVAIQGKDVLKDFDVAKAAGGPRRGIVKECRGVKIRDELTIELKSPAAAPRNGGAILCGVEIVAEEPPK